MKEKMIRRTFMCWYYNAKIYNKETKLVEDLALHSYVDPSELPKETESYIVLDISCTTVREELVEMPISTFIKYGRTIIK